MVFGGELAGLGAALCWALTAILFARAGGALGSQVVNAARLLIAVPLLALTMLALGDARWPWQLEAEAFGWLAASGVVGLALGDAALFHAYVLIGPRLGSLLMALWPAVAAILGWLVLDEQLGPAALAGMVLTLGAVAWVASERREEGEAPQSEARVEPGPRRGSSFRLGVVCGLGGVVGQAVGLVLAKLAMLGAEARGMPAVDPLDATFARMLVAGLVIWSWLAFRGRAAPTIRALDTGSASRTLALGAVFGPFIGVWLSLVSGLRCPVGVAGTLMSTSPLFVLVLVWLIEGRRSSLRAIAGAAIAVVGVALLLLPSS